MRLYIITFIIISAIICVSCSPNTSKIDDIYNQFVRYEYSTDSVKLALQRLEELAVEDSKKDYYILIISLSLKDYDRAYNTINKDTFKKDFDNFQVHIFRGMLTEIVKGHTFAEPIYQNAKSKLDSENYAKESQEFYLYLTNWLIQNNEESKLQIISSFKNSNDKVLRKTASEIRLKTRNDFIESYLDTIS